MIICFNCNQQTKRELDSLLKSQQYTDYSEIITVAISNLTLIHGEMKDGGSLLIGEDDAANHQLSQSQEKHSQGEVKDVNPIVSKRSVSKAGAKNSISRDVESTSVPDLFKSHHDVSDVPSPIDLPVEDVDMEAVVPMERWIFGQYNKILPLKAACRAIANLQMNSPGGILLKDAVAQIGDQAPQLTFYLMAFDKKNNIKPDDATSTAFPKPDKPNSKDRFVNQFIARVDGNNTVLGLPYKYKLIDTEKRTDLWNIRLTDVGWQFAMLPNPILDSSKPDYTEKLSHEETTLLVQHIISSVNVEAYPFRLVIESIKAGYNKPKLLDEHLRSIQPQLDLSKFSDAFLSTQRSGVISRMSDLDLIRRRRSGVYITYELTNNPTMSLFETTN